jgi:hypothetical protein
MTNSSTAIDRLAACGCCGYTADGPAATEPTALAALALLASDRQEAAQSRCDWLARRQNDDGSIGVCEGQAEPCWSTGFAVLAWETATQRRAWRGSEGLRSAVRAAVDWLISVKSEPIRRNPQFGHDTTLVGWPWVAGTHAWIEPTAIGVIALRATGNAAHDRVRNAVRVLVDRQLRKGGANYGNTTVLGQELLPHTQPTALSLLALAHLPIADARVTASLRWLEGAVERERGAQSLCFGLIALAAHGKPHPRTNELIDAAEQRLLHRRPSGYQLALLAHARLGEHSPLILQRQTVAEP